MLTRLKNDLEYSYNLRIFGLRPPSNLGFPERRKRPPEYDQTSVSIFSHYSQGHEQVGLGEIDCSQYVGVADQGRNAPIVDESIRFILARHSLFSPYSRLIRGRFVFGEELYRSSLFFYVQQVNIA